MENKNRTYRVRMLRLCGLYLVVIDRHNEIILAKFEWGYSLNHSVHYAEQFWSICTQLVSWLSLSFLFSTFPICVPKCLLFPRFTFKIFYILNYNINVKFTHVTKMLFAFFFYAMRSNSTLLPRFHFPWLNQRIWTTCTCLASKSSSSFVR